jgi:hypothetical protein
MQRLQLQVDVNFENFKNRARICANVMRNFVLHFFDPDVVP